MITEKDIPMQPIFSEDATDLLQGFLQRNVRQILSIILLQPKKRLGSGKEGLTAIKEHPFFAAIDWDELYKR